MRASEAEREEAVEELRRHASVGRLDADELERRVEAALGARTLDDLATLKDDLPEIVPSEFGEHLRVYLAVNALLVAIWAVTGAGYFWPVWPLMGWGLAVVLHGVCDPGKQSPWPARRSRTRGIASS